MKAYFSSLLFVSLAVICCIGLISCDKTTNPKNDTFVPVYSGPTDGLIAFYPFDGNANDLSGHSRNLTNDSASLTTGFDGRENSAYYFSGKNTLRYNNSTDIAANMFTPNASVSLWLKYPETFASGDPGGGPVVANVSGDWGDSEGWAFQLAEGKMWAHVNVNNVKRLLNVPLIFNRWVHLVLTYDSLNFKYYVDDTLKGSLQAAGKITYQSNYKTLGIGWWNAVPGYEHRYLGSVDQVRIYNRAITAAEVHQLYTETVQWVKK